MRRGRQMTGRAIAHGHLAARVAGFGAQIGRRYHGLDQGNTAKGVTAATGGGGIYVSNATLKAINCRMEYNLSYRAGGAIYAENGDVTLGADYAQEKPEIRPTPKGMSRPKIGI